MDTNVLKRINALAIPPAWKDVWICPSANGHLQATGRDARGRKQYRYHPRWREIRDENKFARMIAFGRALPKIRRRIRRDLRARGLGRDKILATIVRLMDLSAIRIGNDEYAHENKSYGLTTLKGRHARVNGNTIHFRFRGKSGKRHELSIANPRLARIVKKCQHLPGQELFQWVDEAGAVHDVTSDEVNVYLREISGSDFTSKDFRTWIGTVGAACALTESAGAVSQTRRHINRAIEQVARRLGNTPAVCKKCYIHPAILDFFRDGSLVPALSNQATNPARSQSGLRSEEAAVLALLWQQRRGEKKNLSEKLRSPSRRLKSPTKIFRKEIYDNAT